jgi:outer membrane protein OmpA-like peptidoglycan-associated protein
MEIMDEIADLQYRVQIRASRSKLSKEQLRTIYSGDQTPKYFEEDGYYKYYIAQESNYFAAKHTLNELGVKNAFIAAYKEGIKYDLQDAIAAQYRKRMLRDKTDMNDSILNVVTVNFKLDEFILAPDENSRLQEFVANQLKEQSHRYVIVNGHTDIRGSDTYNFGLSEERALFVKEMIIEEGISPERVKSFYFGESQLAKNCTEHENCDESVHEANRRVEIFLITSESSENHVQNSSQSFE